MLSAVPSPEYAVSDDYSADAAGSSTLKGSPRAWLLPFSPPIMMRTCVLEGRQNFPLSTLCLVTECLAMKCSKLGQAVVILCRNEFCGTACD